jgi:hypothetical protein
MNRDAYVISQRLLTGAICKSASGWRAFSVKRGDNDVKKAVLPGVRISDNRAMRQAGAREEVWRCGGCCALS